MNLIKEEKEDSKKETDSNAESNKNTIPKMVNIRESLNVTTTDKIIHGNTELTDGIGLNTTVENMRSKAKLEMKEYTDVLKCEVEFDIPKSRNGRWLSAFGYAKSPHDAEYAEGYNDGINGVSTAQPTDHTLYMAHIKQLESQDKLGADVNPTYSSFPKDPPNANHDEKGERKTETLHQIYPTGKKSALLRRTPLPLMTKWASSTGFEKFITLFESHIGQQPLLQYILCRVFHAIWFKHGGNRNYALVLGMEKYTQVHVSINYITEEQFVIELNYLFSALKQSLVNKGRDLVEREDGKTNDGIVILHNLYERYKYDGDPQTYQSNLMLAMNQKLTRNYPGGPMQYLENWENAAIAYCKISKKTNQEFGNDTKRNLFLASFHVKSYTSIYLESANDYTDSFDELLTFIRRRISRDTNLDATEATVNAHLTQINDRTSNDRIPVTPHEFSVTQNDARVMRTLTHAANNASIRNNNQDGSWRVPDNLWRVATPAQRNIFNELRKRGQANMRSNQSQRPNQRPPRQHNLTSSILPAPDATQGSQVNTTGVVNQSLVQYIPPEDEDTLTLLEEMFNTLDIMEVATINNNVVSINLIQCKVNFNYMVQLAHLMLFLSIIDGGADTHVLGASWIKLFTVIQKYTNGRCCWI